jgi:hypothetical protein
MGVKNLNLTIHVKGQKGASANVRASGGGILGKRKENN